MAIMPVRNGGGRTETRCLVLVLVLLVLGLQMRISSAVQDADEILIKPVAKEQQGLINDLGIAGELVGEEPTVGSISMTVTISAPSITVRGTNGRLFTGTGASGSATGQGMLYFESPGMYDTTTSFQVTRYTGVGNTQHVLFQNALGTTLGVWTGTFSRVVAASSGHGRFVQ